MKVEITTEEILALQDIVDCGRDEYKDEDDEIGNCRFCGVISYKPCKPYCSFERIKCMVHRFQNEAKENPFA